MTEANYDLAIVGAGAAGLIAADFALHLGAKVSLLEKDRIGGDCTWTGCVPSKALIKVAKVAHEVRSASHYGINAGVPTSLGSCSAIRSIREALLSLSDQALHEMVQQVRGKLLDTEVMVGLKKLDLPGVDFQAAKHGITVLSVLAYLILEH